LTNKNICAIINTTKKERKIIQMSKLIIHETNCHGSGMVHYKGQTKEYCYDDGALGDVRQTVETLIDMGFINWEDVLIFDNYENDIYKYLEKLMEEKGD
jgi:hypothetical protein